MKKSHIQNKSFLTTLSENKFGFAFAFIGFFFISFTILSLSGLVPEEIAVEADDPSIISSFINPVATASPLPLVNNVSEAKGEIPVHIFIPAIGVDTPIQNPQSQAISVLDEALKKGAVRYPGSGLAGQGNMFLFAHSTNFRVVNNQAYKAFNNLRKLVAGDIVEVESHNRLYIYRVTKVELVDADQAYVDLSINKNMLTLSSCNTFGEKEERYVVEADFVSSSAL